MPAREAQAGYSVIYLKVGRGETADLRNVAAVRQAIGDSAPQAGRQWRVGRAHGYLHDSQAGRSRPGMDRAADARTRHCGAAPGQGFVAIPIAADQSVFTSNEVYEICRQRAADAIVLSIHEAGGLLAFKKAAAIAEAAGIGICLHGQSVSSITDLAQHHVGLTIPNLTDGNQIMHQLLVEDLVSAPDLTPGQQATV